MKKLTPREMQVLNLMGSGYGNKEIAAALEISEHTTKFHVNNCIGKLGCVTRTQAVVKALVFGLILLDELDYPGMADEPPPLKVAS